MSDLKKPMPDVSDPIVAGYWAGTREEHLRISRCTNCKNALWPPEAVCPVCLHTEFSWEDVQPTGTLWSYAVYHHALDPAFADDLPYAVGLVELLDGFKMYGIVQGPVDALEVGMRVEAVFDQVDDEVTFVRWRKEVQS
jgi:uncharacterized OB-fold protein